VAGAEGLIKIGSLHWLSHLSCYLKGKPTLTSTQRPNVFINSKRRRKKGGGNKKQVFDNWLFVVVFFSVGQQRR
jgi:hypothetical protein